MLKSHFGDGAKDAVTQYMVEHTLRLQPAQEKLIKTTNETFCNHAYMMSSADQMQFLANLAKTISARKTLDIGVFTGYSALSIALTLPADGKVVACDITEQWLEPGRTAWKEAGVNHKIDVRIAPAADTLRSLIANGETETYDLAYIDADKPGYCEYYELCKTLVRRGGIIALDNVLWRGNVADPSNTEENTEAIRAVNARISKDTTVDVSMLKIGDGLTLAFKR